MDKSTLLSILRRLNSRGRIEDILLHELTGLGLIIRSSPMGYWESETFKCYGAHLVFQDQVFEISDQDNPRRIM